MNMRVFPEWLNIHYFFSSVPQVEFGEILPKIRLVEEFLPMLTAIFVQERKLA